MTSACSPSLRTGMIAAAAWLVVACGGGGGGSGSGSPSGNAPGAPQAVLQRVFAMHAFTLPVALIQHPRDDTRWYVVEQGGRVMTFKEEESTVALPFIDISAQVVTQGEAGLLGMAFHPDFSTNGQVYLSYTGPGTGAGPLTSHIARFTSADDGLSVAAASQAVLLSVAQPFANHNGGQIAFGPDGLFYIGLGDGGSAGDPQGNAQNTRTLLGAMLRLDVDRPSGERPYGIPLDNPFAHNSDCASGDGCPEIYAWGFRNPWRWSFDPSSGHLWVGDVGQAAWEEVDRVEKGGNYGWNTLEGSHCYNAADCNATGLIAPVVEYDRSAGRSVTGGYVYRGTRLDLDGDYIYGDFVSGVLFRIIDADLGGSRNEPLLQSGLKISSFAQDRNGEIYVVSFEDGALYRLAASN